MVYGVRQGQGIPATDWCGSGAVAAPGGVLRGVRHHEYKATWVARQGVVIATTAEDARLVAAGVTGPYGGKSPARGFTDGRVRRAEQ